MANLPFDRTVLNPLEQALVDDLNQGFSEADQALREMARYLITRRPDIFSGTVGSFDPTGFLGAGLQVTPGAGLQVVVGAGLGFISDALAEVQNIGGINGLNDLAPIKPLTLPSAVDFAVPANASGSARYDLIEVAYPKTGANPGVFADNTSRNIWDPVQKKFVPGLVSKTLSYSLAGRTGQGAGAANAPLYYKQGAGVSAAAALAAVDAGYTAVAVIEVDNGAVALDYDKIIDARPLVFPGGLLRCAGGLTLSTATSKASLLSLVGQPGLRAGAYYNGAVGGLQQAVVFIAAGGGAGTGNSRVEVTSSRNDLDSTFAQPVEGIITQSSFFGALDAPTAANLNDPTKAGNPVKFAVGQLGVQIALGAMPTAAGAWGGHFQLSAFLAP